MDNITTYDDALDHDEPIEVGGFIIYPILMSEYRMFMAAKNVLLIRQGSLPAKYAVMRYLSALYAMDRDAAADGLPVPRLIGGVLMMLSLAMRFPADALLRQTTIITSERDDGELVSLDMQLGDRLLRLTPEVFDRLRPLIAAQNGLELPDESENADLVESENDIAASGEVPVSFDARTEIMSVARDQRKRYSEMLSYTIREYTDLKAAIDRDKMFTIYRTAECSGQVKFTHGNPVPSWCYDRKDKANSMIAMKDFMAGPGSIAAQHS